MSCIKIMHMADIHFGRPVTGLDESKRNLRRQEVRSTFSSAIDMAKENGVDVILISGDLFDTADTDKSTINFLTNEFGKIPTIPIFIAPGNHDPKGNAYKMLADGGCNNVTIFDGRARCVEIPDKNLAIYGVGFENEVVNEHLLRGLKATDNSKINIAVIHGEVAANSDYNPITEDDIASSGMDYVALGHVHTYSGIKKAGDTFYAYSGTLEGGGFDECDDKGVIYGTVSKEGCSLGFTRLCRRCYRTIEIDVSEEATLQDIIGLVKSKVSDKNDLYKIVLTGKRCETIPEGVIENELDAFFVKVKDTTRGAYNLEEIAKEYNLKGIFARNVAERLANCDETEREALLKGADIVFDILSE